MRFGVADLELIEFVRDNPILYDENVLPNVSAYAKKLRRRELWKKNGKKSGPKRLHWEFIKESYTKALLNKYELDPGDLLDGRLSFLDPFILPKQKKQEGLKRNEAQSHGIDVPSSSVVKEEIRGEDWEITIKEETCDDNDLIILVNDNFTDTLSNNATPSTNDSKIPPTETVTFLEDSISIETDNNNFSTKKASTLYESEIAECSGTSGNLSQNSYTVIQNSQLTKSETENRLQKFQADLMRLRHLNHQEMSTEELFKEIGMYVSRNFGSTTQKEIRIKIWSLIAATELETLKKSKKHKTY